MYNVGTISRYRIQMHVQCALRIFTAHCNVVTTQCNLSLYNALIVIIIHVQFKTQI